MLVEAPYHDVAQLSCSRQAPRSTGSCTHLEKTERCTQYIPMFLKDSLRTNGKAVQVVVQVVVVLPHGVTQVVRLDPAASQRGQKNNTSTVRCGIRSCSGQSLLRLHHLGSTLLHLGSTLLHLGSTLLRLGSGLLRLGSTLLC